MKIQELSFLSLRLLAIYLFYISLTGLIYIITIPIPNIYHFDELNPYQILMIHLIPPIAKLCFALLLWIFANKLSYFLVKKKENLRYDHSPEFKTTYKMIISVVGLMIVIFSITNLIREIPNLVLFITHNANPFNRQYLHIVIAETIKLFIGLALMIKADGMYKILSWFYERNK